MYVHRRSLCCSLRLCERRQDVSVSDNVLVDMDPLKTRFKSQMVNWNRDNQHGSRVQQWSLTVY